MTHKAEHSICSTIDGRQTIAVHSDASAAVLCTCLSIHRSMHLRMLRHMSRNVSMHMCNICRHPVSSLINQLLLWLK